MSNAIASPPVPESTVSAGGTLPSSGNRPLGNLLAGGPVSESRVVEPHTPTHDKRSTLRGNLRRSVLDGGFYGWMVGVGESYIPAFALAIGLGEVTTGLISSVPMLVGGIVQLSSLRAITLFGSYRRWIVVASGLQAFAFLPLVIAACVGTISPWLLFLIVSWYWGTGMAAGPAWNAWISSVVPTNIRSRYFSRRTRLIQLATFGGFLFGGAVIYASNQMESVLIGFAVIFAIAGIARAISTKYLALHQVIEKPVAICADPLGAMQGTTSQVGRRLVVYLVCMQIFVQCSGPYFVPYMFKKLGLSYESFVVLVGASFVAKALSMPLWGAVASRKGGRFLLILGGVGVIPLSSLWTVSDHFGWLLFVQAASGATWAAYELGFFLIFLNHVPQDQRAKLMTVYNFANSMAWFGGSLLGGWLLAYGGASYQAYHWLFWVSSMGRLCMLGLLWRVQSSPDLGSLRILSRIPVLGRKVPFRSVESAR